MRNMCDNCIHKPVCGKFRATGGYVRDCEHYYESENLFAAVCQMSWESERKQVKNGYCPMCNKMFSVYSDDYMIDCPDCGHHINLHIPRDHDDNFEDLSDGALE